MRTCASIHTRGFDPSRHCHDIQQSNYTKNIYHDGVLSVFFYHLLARTEAMGKNLITESVLVGLEAAMPIYQYGESKATTQKDQNQKR